jgi:lysophospholipase L1-like esterase
MTLSKIATVLFLSIFMATVSCSGGQMEQPKTTYSNLKDVPDAAWEKLSGESFYFGHQSVGYNILDGVRDIMKEYPQIKLNIVESSDPGSIAPGTLAHSRVGKNTQPETKIDDFNKYLDAGIGNKVDAAALKFCYVDFMANAEPETTFNEYVNEIEKIHKSYPDLTIIHFTSPLTTLQTGLKAWIKKILGRATGARENINRHAYNELLRAKYKGKAPLLDIAEIESTFPDGSRSTFDADGQTYFSMVPEYTTDGGHLNEAGRKKVAEQFLLLLANLP